MAQQPAAAQATNLIVLDLRTAQTASNTSNIMSDKKKTKKAKAEKPASKTNVKQNVVNYVGGVKESG